MWYVPWTMPAPWLARPLAARLAVSLALAAAVSLALRLPFLSVPLITDEAGYAYVAYWLARGQALYRDLWFDRPQGIFLIYGAILRLVGESTEAIRLAAGLYNAGTTVLLGLLGARLFGPLAGAAGRRRLRRRLGQPGDRGLHRQRGGVHEPPRRPLRPARRPAPAVPGRSRPGPGHGDQAHGPPRRRPGPPGGPLEPCWMAPPASRPASPPGRRRRAGSTLRLRLSALARAALGAALGFAPFLLHGLATDPTGYWYAVVGFRVQAHSAFSVGLPFVGELGQTAPTVLAALLPVWLLACVALWGARWQTSGRDGGPGLLAGRPGRRRRRGLLVLALLRRPGAPGGPPRRRRRWRRLLAPDAVRPAP